MPEFTVGDRVVCNDGFELGFDGEIGTVENITKAIRDPNKWVVHVKFDCNPYIKEWYSYRFSKFSGEEATLTPVCRKIRVMEARWKKFQEGKTRNIYC